MVKFIKIFKWLFAIGATLGLIGLVAFIIFFISATRDLPSVETLAEYKPPVMSRVHAGDGKLISEFRKEARVFVPIETVPELLQHAFVAAEDQRFYRHKGFDAKGFARAMVANVGHVLNGRRMEGGSTLTQQVAKNFLVGNQRNIERKLREVVIARRIEQVMDKDHILELYLNDIYFGRGAYGVAAASLNYFGKPMKDLTLAEVAYLAVLPKAPSNYQISDPVKKERALNRRNYVLARMVEDGYAAAEDAETARNTDIIVTKRFEGEEYLAAEYFVEEARRQIYKLYGQEELYSGGLSIRTTLDTNMQLAARRALRSGLEGYDRRHGYRGPLGNFDSFDDWKKRLAEFEAPKDIGEWRLALVLSVEDTSAELRFSDELTELGDEEELDGDALIAAKEAVEANSSGKLNFDDLKWAGETLSAGKVGPEPKKVSDVLKRGDIILVEKKAETEADYALRQVPEVNGGIIAMDPHTGRILALVGGYSFEQNQFNRVTQAKRQPGSAFKPFVYAAALDNGFTPASQVLDAPFVIERQDIECEENEAGTLELRATGENGQTDENGQSLATESNAEDDECERFYKPSNYAAGRFYGLSTLRLGIEKSRNAMTVRLANDIGMAPVIKYGKAFGIYDEVKPELAWALGAGETTLLRLATAYSTFVNGGKSVEPTILDRVQDGDGKTIFVHADRVCADCQQEEYLGGPPPEMPDDREAVIDPITAYQLTFMLKGVVDNGTGGAIRSLGRPLGGKTGTTNDARDAWFMGFSPDLVAGVYVGFDTPEEMGRESGSSAAVPIFKAFMGEVLQDAPRVPFRIPEGVTLAPVNRNTGDPSYIGAPDFILEAFRPGTEPKLGGLGTTIRVGSGGNTFGDFGSGDSGDDEIDEYFDFAEDDLTEDPQSANDENGNSDRENTDRTGDEEQVATQENAEAAEEGVIADASKKRDEKSAPSEPEPETPAPEEDLDDGIY